jgi:phosphopantetheinyl transferase (holo-ACP synthase)
MMPLTVAARLAPLSLPAPVPAPADGGDRMPLACRYLNAALGPDGALWQRVWALRVLGRHERRLFQALTAPPRRRLEWLAARTAAKEAVAELAQRACGVQLLPAEIEILADEEGRPYVGAELEAQLGCRAIVSLAHTGGRAVAAAALTSPGGRSRIGVDIEALGLPRPGFADAALRAPERALLAAHGLLDSEEWLLRCWCAREAAAKAVGTGLSQAGWPSIDDLTPAAGAVLISTPAGGRGIPVATWREADLVWALAMIDEGDE